MDYGEEKEVQYRNTIEHRQPTRQKGNDMFRLFLFRRIIDLANYVFQIDITAILPSSISAVCWQTWPN